MAVVLCQLFPCHLLPLACAFHQCVYHMLTEYTTRMFHMPIKVTCKPYLFQNEVKFLKLEFYQDSLDLTVATSSGMILKICLIIAQPCAASAEGSA